TAPATPDCDDTDDTIHPNTVWYIDNDGDGYSGGSLQVSCNRPVNYYLFSELIAITGDCDDNVFEVNPNGTEVPNNNIDDDCNPLTVDGTLGIEDFDLGNVLLLPNPFKDKVVVVLPLSFSYNVFNIKIYDLNGRLILDKEYVNKNGKINVSDLNNLENAPYIFKIIEKETKTSITKRLLKY
ncbi:T9SS type A sorting domain-containing protein, partial [Flaviramulus aquimarinus]|uniref:T9SS type A sorting domain-containing protein n=1 Tax=Flaviramulus aquimarinus TaxID=1170456 RepID=UPI0031EF075C